MTTNSILIANEAGVTMYLAPLIPLQTAFSLPNWVPDFLDAFPLAGDDESKMRLVIALAGENIRRQSGGPFGAAVFRRHDSALIAIGVNLTQAEHTAILHAEIVALMLAQQRLASYTLRAAGEESGFELFSSCSPCAMCLGSVLWSGVERLVYAASRKDAMTLGFDEGPVFPESYQYLRDRGVEIVPDMLAAEAREVFERYRWQEGLIYNG